MRESYRDVTLSFLLVCVYVVMAGRVYSWYGWLFLCCLWLVVDRVDRYCWSLIIYSLFVFSVTVSFIYTLWGCFFCLNTFVGSASCICLLFLLLCLSPLPLSSVPVFNIICSAASLLFTCMLWSVPGFLFVFSTYFICSCLLIYFIILLFALLRYLSVAVFWGVLPYCCFSLLVGVGDRNGRLIFFLVGGKMPMGEDCFMGKGFNLFYFGYLLFWKIVNHLLILKAVSLSV